MTQEELFSTIIIDLGENYKKEDETILRVIFNEVVLNALRFSNRQFKILENQLPILASDIRRATKSIYLQRGSEDVKSSSQSGLNSNFDDAMERMRQDIYKGGKRVLL